MRNTGLIFLVISIILIVFFIPAIGAEEKASELLGEEFNIQGARLFPYLIAGIILLVSVLMVIRGRFREIRAPGRDVIILLGIAMVYVALLDLVGFILLTPLCLAACMRFFGTRRWLGLLLMPLLVTGLVFSCFEILMRIELPKGLLEWMFY